MINIIDRLLKLAVATIWLFIYWYVISKKKCLTFLLNGFKSIYGSESNPGRREKRNADFRAASSISRRMKRGVCPSWRSVVPFLSLNKNVWPTGKQMGHRFSVRHVIPEKTNEQASQMLPGEQAGVVKVVTCCWRNTCFPHLHRFSCGHPLDKTFITVNPELLFFLCVYKAETCTWKATPSMSRPVKRLLSRPLCSGFRTIKQCEQSPAFPLQGASRPFITAPLSIAILSSLWFMFCLLSRVQAPETSLNTGSFHCSAPVI